MTSRSCASGALLAVVMACGGTGGGGSGETVNVLSLTVNGDSCSANSYPNKPCVTITVCSPGTATCQTITDILLDTGSVGVRLFKQVLTVPLQPVTVPAGSVGECAQWGDSTSDWGPIQMADVRLAGEPAVRVPIQVIDQTFGTAPAACGTPDPDPATAGFNGILGLGLFLQDCGPGCAIDPSNGVYFACSGASCTGVAVPVASQVQNPVSLLPLDNNGVIVDLPTVPTGGAPSAMGRIVLGIGTRSNNVPAGPTVLGVDANGYFSTTFGQGTYSAFIDTGSNGLFFPPPLTGLPDCPGPNGAWFCPPSTVSLTATNKDPILGTTIGTVPFQIANYLSVVASSPKNNVFKEIGGRSSQQLGFDWGLPFHLGRKVYVGLEGRSSTLGMGPYFAY